jgi:hypothetical protein
MNFKSAFLVTSAGCAATRWLGASLNQHPEILCSSGAAEIADALDYGKVYDAEFAEEIARFNIDHFAAESPQVKHLSNLFDELRGFSDKKFVGNVHLFTIESLHSYLVDTGLELQIPLANVVRHPIPRLDTHCRLWTKNYGFGPNNKKLMELCFMGFESRFHQLVSKFECDLPGYKTQLEKKIFCYSLFDTLNAFVGDFKMGGTGSIPHFRMEDLKERSGTLEKLIRHLTNGEVKIDNAYLDRVYSPGNLNAERFSNAPLRSPAQIWHDWQDWQRFMFQEAVSISGLDQSYRSLGYDFSFLKCTSPETEGVVSFAAPPKLVETNFYGYNLVKYMGSFWGIAQSLGPVNLAEICASSSARDFSKEGRIVVGITLGELKVAIERRVGGNRVSIFKRLKDFFVC